MVVTARGLAKAAEILSGQFTLVATNVPYLTEKRQGDVLKRHIRRFFKDSKADLATAFVKQVYRVGWSRHCSCGVTDALALPSQLR